MEFVVQVTKISWQSECKKTCESIMKKINKLKKNGERIKTGN